jgi:hypothetical protein
MSERAGIHNAIWLCQACATLVDGDIAAYPAARLLGWKETAERSTAKGLDMRPSSV